MRTRLATDASSPRVGSTSAPREPLVDEAMINLVCPANVSHRGVAPRFNDTDASFVVLAHHEFDGSLEEDLPEAECWQTFGANPKVSSDKLRLGSGVRHCSLPLAGCR